MVRRDDLIDDLLSGRDPDKWFKLVCVYRRGVEPVDELLAPDKKDDDPIALEDPS